MEPESAPEPAKEGGPLPSSGGLSFETKRTFVWTLRRWHFIAGGLLFGVLAFWIIAWVPQAFEQWAARSSVREQAAAARESGVDYIAALRDPNAQGKPVRWHLTHAVPGEWYYEGNHSESVVWAGAAPELPFTGQSGSQNYVTVLATVVSSDGKKVTLSFIGRD